MFKKVEILWYKTKTRQQIVEECKRLSRICLAKSCQYSTLYNDITEIKTYFNKRDSIFSEEYAKNRQLINDLDKILVETYQQLKK